MATLVAADLVRHLRFLLARVEAEAVAQNVEALPGRRFTTLGGAVLDCAQVSVSALTTTTGISNDPAAVPGFSECPPGWTINGEMVIVRCAHEAPAARRGGFDAPATSLIEADTERASADAAVLAAVIENIAGDQFGVPSIELQFGQPQGGLLAVVATFSLNTWLPDEDL